MLVKGAKEEGESDIYIHSTFGHVEGAESETGRSMSGHGLSRAVKSRQRSQGSEPLSQQPSGRWHRRVILEETAQEQAATPGRAHHARSRSQWLNVAMIERMESAVDGRLRGGRVRRMRAGDQGGDQRTIDPVGSAGPPLACPSILPPSSQSSPSLAHAHFPHPLTEKCLTSHLSISIVVTRPSPKRCTT